MTGSGGVPTDAPSTELVLAERMLRDLPPGEWLATSAIAPLLAVVFAELDAARAEITSLTHSLRQCEETAASRLAAYEGSVAEVSAQAPVVAAATEYLNEHDNPAPDYVLRKTLRDRLRSALDDAAVRRQQP